ncbi:MAG: tetratricopeptide repeat protein, partial [Rhodospirillaceae bacterium]|nr:tetratricopeptide repeat protein [Rhodospirillaceae bacterium]
DESMIAALGGLIRAQVMNGNIEDARETVNALDAKTIMDKDVAAAISVLELAEQSANLNDNDDLIALGDKSKANPKDMNAAMDYALALYANGDAKGAIDQLLLMIGNDKTWNDAAARKQLVKIFDALGPSDDLVIEGRKKLSILLFS